MQNANYDYSLNQNNMKELPFHKYEQNFTFIVNGKRYMTNRIVADLLSPYIRQLHYIDFSINEFYLTTKQNLSEEIEKTDFFSDFLSLSSFESKMIDQTHRKYFSAYFYILGNIEEYTKLQPYYTQSITIDNVVDRLHSINEVASVIMFDANPTTLFFEEIVEFAALHFEEIDQNELKKLSIEMIEEILKCEKLKLNDEDSLLKFILSIYKENHSYSILFDYVEFQSVSEEMFEIFMKEIELQFINNGIWRSICNRIINPKSGKIESFEKSSNNSNSKNKNNQTCTELNNQTSTELNNQTCTELNKVSSEMNQTSSLNGSFYDQTNNGYFYQNNNVYPNQMINNFNQTSFSNTNLPIYTNNPSFAQTNNLTNSYNANFSNENFNQSVINNNLNTNDSSSSQISDMNSYPINNANTNDEIRQTNNVIKSLINKIIGTAKTTTEKSNTDISNQHNENQTNQQNNNITNQQNNNITNQQNNNITNQQNNNITNQITNIDQNEEKNSETIQEFRHEKGKEFFGIMRYLTNKTGKNIHFNKTIEIKSNSVYWNNYPMNLVDYLSENFYQSLDVGAAFVCFDFKDKAIQMTSYAIQSLNRSENGVHLKSWVIEVSNDKENWIEIDRHQNDPRLNGPNFKSVFIINNPLTDFYRYIRLRQIGQSWYECSNHYYFAIQYIEFYGKLKETNKSD